ncbi:MAG: hypothetical protein ACERKD_01280 [Prolixibacteraceae bacterium]
MTVTEKRSDLIKRISNLDDNHIEKIYNEIIEMLQFSKIYQLTEEENKAIDEALSEDEVNRRISKSKVVSEAKTKYPNLKFK